MLNGVEEVDLPLPEHEDFFKLAEIMRQLDKITTEEGWHIAIQTLCNVDLRSMGYVANAQSLRAQQDLELNDDGTPIPERERNVILWIDAFTAGYRMARLEAEGIPIVPDGNRRSRRAKGKKNRA